MFRFTSAIISLLSDSQSQSLAGVVASSTESIVSWRSEYKEDNIDA